MKSWTVTIDISKAYFEYEDDQDFAKYKAAVLEELKNYSEVDDCLVQQLKDVVDDLDEWDEAMNDLYDFCDEKGIWLRTI